MKVKSWIRRHFITEWVEDEKIRNILYDKHIGNFNTYKEEIFDIDESEILDIGTRFFDEPGYGYCNKLYDMIHEKSSFVCEKDDLEYEIIEEGYPNDIPYADRYHDTVEDFRKWMLEEGIKEREEDNLKCLDCSSDVVLDN